MRLRCCSWILFMGVMPFLRISIHKKQFCPHREGIGKERERERKKILLLLCILYMFTCLFRGHRVTTTCSRICLSVLDQIWMLYCILHPQIWLQTIMESMSHSCLTEEVNVSCNVHSLQYHCSWKFLYPDCKMSAMSLSTHIVCKSPYLSHMSACCLNKWPLSLTGYYSSTGAGSCIICPGGKNCSDPAFSGSLSDCLAGTFSREGDAGCSNCATGYVSGAGASNCTICPPGKDCTNQAQDVSSLSNCSAGTFSSLGMEGCSPCSTGYYSGEGAESCTICPGGKNCLSAALTGSDLPDCPAGSFSVTGDAGCTNCNAGYISSSGSSSCSLCPAGKDCTSQNASQVSDCAAGTYSPEGSAVCSNCLVGYYSRSGAGNCSICPAGKDCSSSALTAANLSDCPAGTFSQTGDDGCTSCEPGYYSTAGSDICTICPAGSDCSNVSLIVSVPPDCPAGWFSRDGDSACQTCPSGRCCMILYGTHSMYGTECTATFLFSLQALGWYEEQQSVLACSFYFYILIAQTNCTLLSTTGIAWIFVSADFYVVLFVIPFASFFIMWNVIFTDVCNQNFFLYYYYHHHHHHQRPLPSGLSVL